MGQENRIERKTIASETNLPDSLCDLLKEKCINEQDKEVALVVNDILGGKIMKYTYGGIVNHYNSIDGKIVDFRINILENRVANYINSEEIERQYLLSDSKLKQRYLDLLKIVYDELNLYIFEEICHDKRVDRNYFDSIVLYNDFEIDSYCSTDEYEIVQFDLDAQNTGNIFRYKFLKETGEYIMIEKPLLYTAKTGDICPEIPRDVLDKVFSIARDNAQNMKRLEKLEKQINIIKI